MEAKDNFNKLQYSKFVGQDQFVVRSNNKVEFLDLVAFIDDFCSKTTTPKKTTVAPVQKTFPPSTGNSPYKKQEVGETCNQCGEAEIVLNPKTGKTFCKNKCWLKKEY